jgi:hypothetical protein
LSESATQPAPVDQSAAKHDGFIVQFVARGTNERLIILLSRSFSGFMTRGKLVAKRGALLVRTHHRLS